MNSYFFLPLTLGSKTWEKQHFASRYIALKWLSYFLIFWLLISLNMTRNSSEL